MNNNILLFGLADWITDKEPNYPSFEECKEWVQIKLKEINSNYLLTTKDEDNIRMLLEYLPMSQIMNNKIFSKYLEETLKK
tara:strand:- start:222 stop:464 length:243 start_codon:yes stop_codon:yes gene_type:complete